MIRTRYAPSPTGFMHIGNLRTALFEYLIAKKGRGVFVLRIEDTDSERFVEGATDAIFETMELTGLKFDEGPGIGGDYGPYVQSERKADYLPHAKNLVSSGKAYYCFCDKERLDGLADERGLKKYDRFCQQLSADEIEKRLASGAPYVIRQLIPDGKTTFHDEVFGDITIDNREMEDQILIKSDGMPTYNFANVIDDHAMKISHVVRGSEYLTSTPKYKLLYEALGWDVPVFVHLPLLQNAAGQKISKRNGDASIPQLLEEGFLPQAIVNYAALLGWSPPDNREIFTLAELESIFEPKNISKSPSAFDVNKLRWVNGEQIKTLPPEVFYEMALPYLKQSVKKAGADYAVLAKITQSRVTVVKDCAELVDFIDELPDYDIELYTHKKMKTNPEIAAQALKLVIAEFAGLADWNHDALFATVTKIAEANELKNGQVLWPIRTALSGKPTTPCGATEICELLGKDETLKRLEIGLAKVS
ncbi:MAG: glutamate--tRNA ligase [Defluviitaleaceae bacterium]|nr:glutamate--tRNA ligase [Defluviitaleaceae bacterium]MCL2262600.1 glutamate--tRNA ligase [Defluviitaleaceae bacterium]